ncbi:hypothetical protein JB92DRAFT_2669292, partial [Gautieria morchelliformis]
SICVDERRDKIFAWLAAPDHQPSHTSAQKKTQPDTGLWFVRGETFKAWRDLPHSTLWLHGKMGSGKTIICSTLVNELFLPNGRDPLPAVAYFYFTNKQTGTNVAVRSLINQLSLTMTSDIPAAVESLYSQHSEGRQSPTLGTLISTLKSLIASIPHLYIVLDALEECLDRNELLRLIQEIHGFGSLHLLATSREELDITDTWSPEVKEKVETSLMNGAHGMFRWVPCQLDALGKCHTSAAVEAALQSLPRTLYETYDNIFLNIQEADRQSALKVLQWLAFSVRATSLAETVEILATNPNMAGACLFNPNERLLNPQEVLIICSSLVTIENTSRYLPCTTNRAQVRLAHFSVKEYLTLGHVQGGCASMFHFNQKMANTFIAETCLAYLSQFNQPFYNHGIRHLNYPLSQYAAEHWTHHARSSGCSSDTLQWLIMALLHSKDAMYTSWIELHDPDGALIRSFHNYRMGGPLYYTSLAGLEIPLLLLLARGVEANAHGGRCGSALQAAASKGHKEIVQLLLEHGANANAFGGQFGTALQAAASCSDMEII